MRLNFKIAIKAILLLWSIAFNNTAYGQSSVLLHIGDPAPELRYSKWIKGSVVKSYLKDRLYVVEFWATWCVPCKQAMPHLSDLAAKYAEKATFIGVNIWEMTGGRPYESSLPEVIKFVDDMGGKMAYDVIADNNEQYMSNYWMKVAGQSGIPATFLVKNGHVIWIGLPRDLEPVMVKVIAGTYDMTTFKGGFEAKVALANAESAHMSAVLKPINDQLIAKNFKEAFSLIDKALVENPSMAISLKDMKFTALLNHKSEAEALTFARAWANGNSTASYMVAKGIADRMGLSRESYLYAAQIFEEKLKQPRALSPVLSHALASCYSKAGEVLKAIEAEEKALLGARAALAEGKWSGAIMPSTVTQYQETLEKYKRHDKNNHEK